MSEDMDQGVHSLLGPYVVDAVTDDERAAFVRHLEACADCRAEVASLGEVAAALAAVEAIDPPAALRDRVMRQIDVTAQLTPTEAAAASRLEPRAAAPARRAPRRWLPLTAAAAAVVAVAAVGLSLLLPRQQATEASAMQRDAMMIASAPDAESMDMDLGATHVVVSDRMDGVALMGADTPMPADGMEYQLWLMMDDGTVMAGPTFMPDADGEVMTVMHTSLDDVAGVAVTEEPMGGSSHPTSDTVASVTM
ncbi:anti-sigma factor [Demequina capsici]|uniref:Regulator of SigK n=1 Tax=Demequina capsici TaxID=3075620 RepID=A0AA96J5U9_9MICO|nr:anti-sigma factor [Demequina sp. OYTSA14]WNM23487.1 anti-sigma factor [Demequina sp. OYTSA14]